MTPDDVSARRLVWHALSDFCLDGTPRTIWARLGPMVAAERARRASRA